MLPIAPRNYLNLTMKAGFNNQGISLLELLCVLSLFLSLSITSFYGVSYIINQEHKKILLAAFPEAIHFAQLAALEKNQTIYLCAAVKSSKPAELSCGSDWSQGMLIFSHDKATTHPNPEDLLLKIAAFSFSHPIIWRGWLKDPFLAFFSDGFPHGHHGTFYEIDAGKETPLFILNELGRLRLATDSSL